MLLFFEGKGETKIDSQTYFILNVLNCALFGKLDVRMHRGKSRK